jgi:hypothetical protein
MMESRKEWVGACWFVGIELKPRGGQLKTMRANWESWKRVWRFLCKSSWRPFLVLQSILSHKLPTSQEAKSHNCFSSFNPVLVLKWLQPLGDIHIGFGSHFSLHFDLWQPFVLESLTLQCWLHNVILTQFNLLLVFHTMTWVTLAPPLAMHFCDHVFSWVLANMTTTE